MICHVCSLGELEARTTRSIEYSPNQAPHTVAAITDNSSVSFLLRSRNGLTLN